MSSKIDNSPESRPVSGVEIIAADCQPPLTRVEIPGIGGHAFIKVLSGPEWSQFQRTWADNADKDGKLEDPDTVKAWLLVLSACDADRKPLWTEADVPVLANVQDHRLTHDLIEMSFRINNIGQSAIKDLAKNFDGGLAAS